MTALDERNVYSLVLLQDVVEAVDRLACERGTSRSGLINQILAEYLSCATPEDRIRGIFECMEQMFSGAENFQVRSRQSETMLNIRSALRYRYNPTVRYALELYRQSTGAVGELRISLRTQSPPLVGLLTEFFTFRSRMEDRWIGGRFPGGRVPCEIGPGRYTRTLLSPQSEQDRTSERIADAICAYIREFDGELKRYLDGADDPARTRAELEREYRNYLRKAVIL